MKSRRPRQLELAIPQSHGGRRPGAGRPNLSGLQSHVRRPRLTGREPVHITLKLHRGLPSLRSKEAFRCLRAAVKTARKQGFGVVHFAVLSNHVHLILEPPKSGLGRLMQGFCISFSKRLNAKLGRKGPVFLERYHLHVLKTPTEAKRALAYVLTNEARHHARAKRRPARRFGVKIDPFSSAYSFRDWKALLGAAAEFVTTNWSEALIESWHHEILVFPKTWLLRQGWRRGGKASSSGAPSSV